MYETILVPIDGSDAGDTALQHAVAIADRFDATVAVLTVVEPAGTMFTFDVEEVDRLDTAFREIVEAVVKSGVRERLHTEVRRGSTPYRSILAYAEEIGADLIVAGRHGRTSVPEAVLGSTADRLARLSDVPVMLVPRVETESGEE